MSKGVFYEKNSCVIYRPVYDNSWSVTYVGNR